MADVAPAVCLSDFEELARGRISSMAYEYIAGGAADEITLRANRDRFDGLGLKQRVLVDVSHIDPSVKLLSERLAFPCLLAPTAYHRLVHPEGELATVRGAGEAGATMVVSSLATTPLEEIASAAKSPLWFQLYVQPDRAVTRDLVQRAESAGCRALCVTVDTPVVGTRNREARAGFQLPSGVRPANLRGLVMGHEGHRPREDEIYSNLLDASLTWKDIEWLRSLTNLPVLLKGITAPEDAAIALKEGVAGLIVSNHGARNLDTAPATIDALPRVIEEVQGRIPVLMDGGVRRGTDVLKAVALGASAVLIGRPYLYALGVNGAHGVRDVLRILRIEFEMAMALTGCTNTAAIDRSILWSHSIESRWR